MDWVKLIIPLIAVAVWIISNLAKQAEAPKRLPPPLPPDPNDPTRPRRPMTDLEKFLEEVRKRKEQDEPVTDAVLVEEVPPPPRPVPPPLPRRPERPRPPRQVTVKLPEIKQPEFKEPVVVIQPAAPPLSASAAPLSAPLIPVSTLNITAGKADGTPRQGLQIPMLFASSTDPTQSPLAKNIAALLKNPKSLAAVFLIREILDEPVCRQRRRR